jgi:hypothetical protein
MYYAIKRWLKWELPHYPKYFLIGVKNLWKWFPIIWKDRDWDDYYIWIILEKKLAKQAKYIGEKNRHVSASRDAERMMTCVRLIKRVREEYYSSEYSDYHKSEFHWDEIPDRPNHKQLRIEELWENFDEYFKKYPRIRKQVMEMGRTPFNRSEKCGIAVNIAHINHKRAKKLLFNILNDHIESWWD